MKAKRVERVTGPALVQQVAYPLVTGEAQEFEVTPDQVYAEFWKATPGGLMVLFKDSTGQEWKITEKKMVKT